MESKTEKDNICRRCGAAREGPKCTECGFTPDATDDWLGKTLAGFRILKKIAGDPSSAVYEAKGSSRAVIKLILQRLDHELTARLQREAEAIRRLQHPAVVRLLIQGETENQYPFLITELIEGETLLELLQQRTLSEQELKAFLRPIGEAMEEAHQKGIFHRDLTPRNIMIQRDGAPRLLDFGFASLRGAETLTERGVVSGTPAYMSPEQWRGLSRADARSDLYSLGVISYQCLSGRLPLEAKTPLEWLKKHAFEAPRDLSIAMQGRPLSSDTCQAIMRALQKDPAQRQASIRDFLQELRV